MVNVILMQSYNNLKKQKKMGGIHKEASINGKSLQLAFAKLQEEDRDEYGSDYYSGGWNNAQASF